MRILFALTIVGLVSLQTSPGPEPLSLVKTIDLPGVQGRIDHLAIDTAARRLFVAALGNNTVEVLDVKEDRHLKSLPGFHEPQGIAFVPDLKLIAVANGQGDGVQVLDAADFRAVKSVRLGDDADNVRYDAAGKRLFVGFGSGALAAVDPADGSGARPGEAAGPSRIVPTGAIRSSNVCERSNRRADRCCRPDGYEGDWRHGRSRARNRTTRWRSTRRISACSWVADGLPRPSSTTPRQGKEVGSFDIVGDTDDLWYDGSRKRLYVSGGEGFIDVLQEQDASRFTRLAHVPTAAGARTSLFVADQNRLYLAVPHRGKQKAEIRVYETR